MATYAREATIRRLPERLWHPALYQYDMRNTVLLSTPTPVLPPFFYDTTQWRPTAPWRSAMYFDPPNTTIVLPTPNPSVPTRAPEFGLVPPPRRNASLYFDSPNVTINAQLAFIGSPVRPVDLTPRLTVRPVLDVQYPPNLSLSLLISNPYVPVDLSGQVPAGRRNAALYFDTPNLSLRLLSGARPIIPVDWNMRSAVRQPIIFDAPNLVNLLSTGAAPIRPADVSGPVRPAPRCTALYDAQGSLLTGPLFVAAVLPPIAYPDIGYRYSFRRNAPAAEWIEPQRALLAVPSFLGNTPNLSYSANTGIQVFSAGLLWSGATSFSIAPATDAGITFSTVTGAISTDTAVASIATHGPYIITATNTNGSRAGNSFTITITSGNYHVDGPRVTKSTTALGTTYGTSGPRTTRDTPESEDLT